MPALTTSKTTTKPAANGRYKTKTERATAILHDGGTDLSYAEFRQEYKARYGEDPGPNDTTFYRVRSKLRLKTLDLASPNIAERPTSIVPASKPGNGVGAKPAEKSTSPITTTWTVANEVPHGISVSKVEALAGSKPLRRPGSPSHFDDLLMATRQPILTLAASMGGLMALRRAVDELIGGLAPELKEEAKSP